MRRFFVWGLAAFFWTGGMAAAEEPTIETGGRLACSDTNATIWWALSSVAKVRPQTAAPTHVTAAAQVRCARNEYECVQVLVRPNRPLRGVTAQLSSFAGKGQQAISLDEVELLRAVYLEVKTATDRSTVAGLWPDPLVAVREVADLAPGTNYAYWVRLHVPRTAATGGYRALLTFHANGWKAEVPVELTVYDFTLPDVLSCQTAFGFSPGEVFRYQHLENDSVKRQVLDKYWADFSAHHISPYDPAPLDPMRVTWPEVNPPKGQWDDWHNARLVTNEVHSGTGALLVYDDKPNEVVAVNYLPAIAIPPKGLRLRGWYRTAVPGHQFAVALNHYDAEQKWMSGRNKDFSFEGNGAWQSFERSLTEFPAGAKYVRLTLMATTWTEAGEKMGLVWFDDLSLQDLGTGAELLTGGDFERRPRTELCAPAERLRPAFDFSAWDAAVTRAFDYYHFNSLSVPIPGLGGGTFHELLEPKLQGFGEDTPEYPLLLGSYCGQMDAHLRGKGWLKQAYIYWFDEPAESQYPYLQNGFNKLKRYCSDIPRMITKRVESGLIGGPNIWCPISDEYNHEKAEERRALGERFWWYVCTGPKGPYAGLFLDHAAPEMRIWLWQTFQRNITGVLVWQCNYWNSGTAYPEAGHPQNPYEDPMSWMSGYGTPAGKKSPWGNGDGRFFYPPVSAASGKANEPVLDGPVDSIRWEQLRDGLEDYGYLTLLRQQLNERRAGLSAETIRGYEELLKVPESITRSMTEFARDGAAIELRRDEIARAIEKLIR